MSTISSSTALPPNLRDINGGDESVARASNTSGTGIQALDQGDFLRLLTTQLQQQDPLEPVDNKDMLAQMAQFSALAGTAETNSTLADISTKLDALIAAQSAPANSSNT